MSSVYVRKRRESRYEPIIHAETLRDELIEFAKREYGIRDPKTLVRKKYVIRKNSDDYDFYLAVLYEHRREINQRLILLIDDLYSANAIYPTTSEEFDRRREFLNMALARCSIILKELQEIVNMYDVDLNTHKRYQEMIDREIYLIKRWRQRDNRMKARLNKGIV